MSNGTPKVFGYPVREPFATEDRFFKENPQIGGMAAEDDAIVLNPYSPLSDAERTAVSENEAARLWMRAHQPDLNFELTEEQRALLSGTSYAGASTRAQKETVIGRILSGDPSGGTPTPEQLMAADRVRQGLMQRDRAPAPRGAMYADGAFGVSSTPVGDALGVEIGPQFAEGDVVPLPRRGGTVGGVIPWSEIEGREQFQGLSAHGKRLVKAQYLADLEKHATARFTKEKDRQKYMETTLGLLPEYKDPTRSIGDWLSDFNLAIQSGVATVTGSVGETLGVGEGQFEGDPMSLGNLFNPAAQEKAKEIWQGQKSLAAQDFSKFKAEREAAARAEGKGELGAGVATAKAYASRPGDFLLAFGEQIPIVGAFIGPGGLVRAGTRLATGAPKAIETALTALRAGKLTKDEAAIAIKAAEMAGIRAGQVTTGALGASLGASDSKQQFVEAMTSVPDAAWEVDPEYAQAVAAGQDPKEVKKRLAQDRAGWATAAGAVAGIFSGISGFERLFIGPAVAGMRKRLLSAGAEPLTEMIENTIGLGIGNLTAQGLDPKRSMTQGFGPAIAEAVALSSPFAAAAGLAPGGGTPEEVAAGAVPPAAAPAAEAPAAPGPPGGPPPGGAGPAAVGEIPSAIGMAETAIATTQGELDAARAVEADANSTPEQVSEARQVIAEKEKRLGELQGFVQAWQNVPVVAEIQRDIAKDERRIAEINADQRADPDSSAREIAALEGRIERNRQLAAINNLDENELQGYIDSRSKSLAAASGERGLGITVDRARLTNEISHAQRLLEERAEIPTPAEVEFKVRAPTVFQTDAAGVPIWPTQQAVDQMPFIDAANVQRDRALSLIDLVRGNPQYSRGQRTAAISQARAHWEAVNRIASAWNLNDQELAQRRDELIQALGSGVRGATSLNQSHFMELAGVLAAQGNRAGQPLTWRQAQLMAQKAIAAIYAPPTVIGPGQLTGTPKNPAGDTSVTKFYDDDPTLSQGDVLARTPTADEQKLWTKAVNALAKLGFNKSALDALGIRIGTSETALGLYLPSANDKIHPNIAYTLSVTWGKHGNDKDRQWTVIHEISHALADSERNGTDISAKDPRFRAAGEFRTELEAAYNKGNGPMQNLHYPLDPGWRYSEDAIAAELWAQSTAYYFLDRNLLKQHAPKTFAFVEAFYANLARNQFTTRQQVAAAVSAGFSGVPPAAGVPGGQPPGGAPGPAAPGAGPGPPVAGPAPGGPAGPQPPAVGGGGVLGGTGVTAPTPPTPTAPVPPSAAPTTPAPTAPAPAAPVAVPPPPPPLAPPLQARFDEGQRAGQAVAAMPGAQQDPGLAAWRGFPPEDLDDAMDTARQYFALPEGPAKQALGSELRDLTGGPQVGTWNDVLSNLAYRAGLSTGLGKRSASAEDLSRAIEEQQRIIDDAISSVEDEIAAGGAVAPPSPAATPPAAGAPGKPAKPKRPKKPKAAKPAVKPSEAAPAAVEGPVRPAEGPSTKLRRPGQPVQAAAGAEKPAPAKRGKAARATPLAATAVKPGDRVLDEFGAEVVVDSVEDGTVYVKGKEGFAYETTPYPLGETPRFLRGRRDTRLQRNIADEIARLDEVQENIEDEIRRITEIQENADPDMAEEIETILDQLDAALDKVKEDKAARITDLREANRMQHRIQNPTSAVRLQQIIGKLLGIDPQKLPRQAPAIEFATSGDVDPKTKTLQLRGGVTAGGIDPGVVAFYLPGSNRLVFFVDNIRKGEELSVVLHEMFHKRGRQLLGKETMARLQREAMRWKDAPVGSMERKIYDAAMPKMMAGIASLPESEQREAFREELLPYFITEAYVQGVRPDMKAIMAPTAQGWLTRVKAAFTKALASITGKKPDPAQFGAQELMAAAWGAAQLERGSMRYELMARGQPATSAVPGEAEAAAALRTSPIFERALAQLQQRANMFVPELVSAQQRKVYSRRAANAVPLNETRIQAIKDASPQAVAQAANAPPPVGPTNPQKSFVERYKPSNIRSIATKDDLDNYMRTGNRPSLPWLQQQRDRLVENYVDHQRPFQSWLRRHALPLVAWAKLKLVPGRLKARTDKYQRELMAPIERKVAAFAKQMGIPYDQAALDAGWLPTLQHIKEANAALRQKLVASLVAGEPGAAERLALFDRTQRGALKPGERQAPMAGGLTDADAATQLQHLAQRYTPEQMAQLQKIADDIVGAFATLKDDAVASGQISKDALKNFPKFQRYVALTGPNQPSWDDQISDGFGSYIAENRLREREGRTGSVSESALEALAERVGRVSAYDASKEFKEELNRMWTAAGGDQNTIGLRRFTANLVQSPTRSDIIWNAPDGKRYVFRFDESDTIGEALLSKNREYHDNVVLRKMDWLTKKFSRMVTQWIPAFGPINAMRDVQEKAILIRSRDVKDANGKDVDANQLFKKSWAYAISPDTWRAARQLAFGANKMAQENTTIGRYANELIKEGGLSTWGQITKKGLDSIQEAVAKEGRRAGHGPATLNAWQKIDDFVSNYNLMFEIVSSLSVNAAMRDLNVPTKDAAFQTLDLMNFQNVGAKSGWTRAAYSFFNPAAQSGYNLYKQVIKSPRGRRDLFALLAVSFFVQGLLRMLADDDEELGNELDQRGVWETDRNVTVNLLGVPLKIPVGFGAPQFAWGMMNSSYRFASGRYDTGDLATQAIMATVKSFTPLPVSEIGFGKQPINFLTKTFTPTVFRPAIDFATDSDAWGGKLTAYYPDKTKFRAEQGRPTTSVFYKDMAELLQGTGLDMYPEQVKALAEAVAWGPYGYVLQGVADWNKEQEGRRLNPMDKLPASAFLRFMGTSRLIGGESRYLEARYYENYDRALDDLRDFNRAKSEGKESQWRSEHPERMRRVTNLQKQERVMRGLSKEFNTAVRDLQNEKINYETAQPRLTRIQDQRERAMREFLKNLRVWDEEEDDEP